MHKYVYMIQERLGRRKHWRTYSLTRYEELAGITAANRRQCGLLARVVRYENPKVQT